ncbi:hypothetical protein [uncultured Culturomica sp.]|mgnify:CR=1 FL=1|jgi:hypothetical protein|uniref:hypothetical protein n=1 Tax=uncultured Culturomica sp. TaxID=1926654 RepID=UPI0003372A31|nr:hypothetical protein [uncultured Culturomica sp.]CCZ10530.1 unknown [Odoribacter sp. CAG:788]
MNDLELQNIIEKSREYLPDPKNQAKPGKAKIYRVPYIPPIDILTEPKTVSDKIEHYEVEFELIQTGRNKFDWEYKRFIQY